MRYIFYLDKEFLMKKFNLFLFILSFILNIELFGQTEQSSSDNPFSQSKFVPDISFILDASYLHRNLDNDEFKLLEVPGLIHSSSEEAAHGHEHAEMNSQSGFNFNYAELSVSSTVDPYFDLIGIFHLSAEGFEVEEGYFTTRSLPLGFQVKGGKFLSGIGRINEQHAHYWDFANMPLVYKAFFGPEGLNEVGAQINWITPTDFYLLIGGELLKGDNENSFGTAGYQDSAGSIKVKSSNAPNLYTGFVRTSIDIGNFTALTGVSGAFGKSRINHGFDSNAPDGDAIYANTRIWNANLTMKYIFESYRDLTLQFEYLNRITDGDLYSKDSTLNSQTGKIKKDQSGLYAHLVYKFDKNWRIGMRYDLIAKNEVIKNNNKLDLPDNLPQFTGMIEYNPTEFSRIRLQYSHDRTKYLEKERKINNEILLQVNLTIGAHGAHSF